MFRPCNSSESVVDINRRKVSYTKTDIGAITARDANYGAKITIRARSDDKPIIWIDVYEFGFYDVSSGGVPNRNIKLANRDHLVRLHELIGKVLDEWKE